MKINEFKTVIRQLVMEEVQKEVAKQLPKLLFEMIGQQPKPIVRESAIPSVKPQSVQKPVFRPQQVPQPPKPMKKYAKDPVLNAILNETTAPIPHEDTGVPLPMFDKIGGVSDEFIGEMRDILSENTIPVMDQPIQQEEVVPTTNGPDLNKLFNKNFKAILDKSKSGHGGGFSNVLQNW